jgi:hypothetical protein
MRKEMVAKSAARTAARLAKQQQRNGSSSNGTSNGMLVEEPSSARTEDYELQVELAERARDAAAKGMYI